MPSFSCNEIFITKWGSFDSEDGRYFNVLKTTGSFKKCARIQY